MTPGSPSAATAPISLVPAWSWDPSLKAGPRNEPALIYVYTLKGNYCKSTPENPQTPNLGHFASGRPLQSSSKLQSLSLKLRVYGGKLSSPISQGSATGSWSWLQKEELSDGGIWVWGEMGCLGVPTAGLEGRGGKGVP